LAVQYVVLKVCVKQGSPGKVVFFYSAASEKKRLTLYGGIQTFFLKKQLYSCIIDTLPETVCL